MNPIESQSLCKFCSIKTGIYTCPRCNLKYCSSQCYKHMNHSDCSEQFFREWVVTSTQQEMFDIEQKNKILRMIKNSESLCDAFESEKSPLEHRFSAIDLNSTSEDEIWNQLTQEEKDSFKKLCSNEEHLSKIIQVQKPWWEISEIKFVSEVVSENDISNSVAPRPIFPLNIKKLSTLTSISPSKCVQYNLVNILYTYAFLFKFHNSDLRDLLEDVVESMLNLSPVLSKGVNYSTLDEAVQNSLSLVTSSHSVTFDFAKSIVTDVCKLLRGPSNAQPITYVLCALHDLKLLILEMREMSRKVEINSKTEKQLLTLAVKKIEYLMSWSLDHPDFEDLAMQLYLVLLPDNILESREFEDVSKSVTLPQRPLIEEI